MEEPLVFCCMRLQKFSHTCPLCGSSFLSQPSHDWASVSSGGPHMNVQCGFFESFSNIYLLCVWQSWLLELEKNPDYWTVELSGHGTCDGQFGSCTRVAVVDGHFRCQHWLHELDLVWLCSCLLNLSYRYLFRQIFYREQKRRCQHCP